jgi:hypothetical protein
MKGFGHGCIEKAHYVRLYRYKENLFPKMQILGVRALSHGWLNEMKFRVVDHICKLYLKDQLKD